MLQPPIVVIHGRVALAHRLLYMCRLQLLSGGAEKRFGTSRELLENQHYYTTMFPRIPVPVFRDIQKRLLTRDSGTALPFYNASGAIASCAAADT